MLAAGLAGCGASRGIGTSTDPASAVPASVPLYVGATVRPQGAQRSAALSAGTALTHQANPYLRLLAILQTPGSAPLSFSRDVAPWLGQQAGIFVSSLGSSSAAAENVLQALLAHGLLGSSSEAAFPFGAGGAQGAIVLDTSDAAKAGSFLAAMAGRARAHATAYRGLSYQTTDAGVAFALVRRLAVIGSESGVRSVIDTTLGGAALAHASGYATLLAAAPSSALAHVYSNPAIAAAKGAAATLAQLLTGAHEANLSLIPAQGQLALDADLLPAGTAGAPGGLLSSAGAGGAQAMAELPGDSWLALGLADAGATLSEDVRGLKALASLGSSLGASGGEHGFSAFSLKSLLEGLLAPLADLGAPTPQARRDYTSWMGSAGVFASGASLLELKGAAVITSKNPALSRAAVGKLAAQLRAAGGSVAPVSIPGTDAAVGVRLKGLPAVLDIADGRSANGHTKFVLALGEASVAAALNPSSTLSGGAASSAAASALGEGIRPNLIVELPTFLSLLEGVGLTEDPSISKLVPYLRSATTLAGGVRNLTGGAQRVRLVLGLR
jgi:hypothetical protein